MDALSPTHVLDSSLPLSSLARSHKLFDWSALVAHVRLLPYGRNSSRSDLSTVLKEGVGSCSSKHAFLAQVAIENEIKDITLVLGVYKMSQANTPGIGKLIDAAGLTYIPEAHCYLRIAGKPIDVTNSSSNIDKVIVDLLEEKEIRPEFVAHDKPAYHRNYIDQWVIANTISLSGDEVWSIREQCIKRLSELEF